MKEKFVGAMQKFSKAIVAPVLFLPAVGISIVICNLFITDAITNAIPFLKTPWINIPFRVLYDGLMSVFTNLGPIFAIGIAFGLARRKKEHAALIAFMSLFIYLAAQNSFLAATGKLAAEPGNGQGMMLGFQVIDAGIFVGIIIGILVGMIHNKFCEKDLGEIFSVYGGTTFVFIICIPAMLALAIGITYIWPPIQNVINNVGYFIGHSGGIGFFTFGFLERLLIPTGFQHIIGNAIWFTELGGKAVINGKEIIGAWPVALAELQDPTITKLSITTVFNSSNLVKMFGLTGAGLAMMSCAKPENKKKVRSIYIPAMLTSFLTTITEPIEFTFLFVSPLLYFIHSVLTGVFFFLLYAFRITCAADGGLLETLLYNVPAGAAKTNWPYYLLMGVVQLIVYFVIFKWFILKFNVKVPGRDDSDEIKLKTKKDYETKKVKEKSGDRLKNSTNNIGKIIFDSIGGFENICLIDNCFTRLRIEVKDVNIIKEDMLKQTGSKGLVRNGNEIQIIYGVDVRKYRKMLEDYIEFLKNKQQEVIDNGRYKNETI